MNVGTASQSCLGPSLGSEVPGYSHQVLLSKPQTASEKSLEETPDKEESLSSPKTNPASPETASESLSPKGRRKRRAPFDSGPDYVAKKQR